ncbi:MAG: metallophosphoesterase family protein [Saprospiraceae bacterium]|jgi:putative phosphoesterase
MFPYISLPDRHRTIIYTAPYSMVKIGLFSDTHGYADAQLPDLFADCHEVWHAGDIGPGSVLEPFLEKWVVRAVYGNIDAHETRLQYPEDQRFEIDGLKVWMTHIVGPAGKYTSRIRKGLETFRPGLLVCGHSHILKVMPVPSFGLLHMNPGAAGRHGFHRIRTALRFEIEAGRVQNLEVIELGLRGRSAQ